MADGEVKVILTTEVDRAKVRSSVKEIDAEIAKQARERPGGMGGPIGAGLASHAAGLRAREEAEVRAMYPNRYAYKPQAAAGLQSFINQSLGVGAAQYRPDRSAYEAFWASQGQQGGAFSRDLGMRGIRSMLYGAGMGGAGRFMSFVSNFLPVTTSLVAGLVGLGAAFKILRKQSEEMAAAQGRAVQLYSKALSSGGLSLEFVARRAATARVLGVSEADVFRFGNQGAWGGTRAAAQSMAAAAQTLTPLEQMRRMTELNKEAAKMEERRIGTAFEKFTAWTDLMGSKFELWLQKRVTSMLGFTVAAPAARPAASPNRYPGSNWERLGLVVGSGGFDPARQTASSTASSAHTLQQIHELLVQERSHGGGPTAGPHGFLLSNRP